MFHTFEELNAWLGQRCRALWGELLHPQYNPLTVANVLELERAELMPIPTVFDGYVERTVRVSSTCLSAWMPLRRATTETLCPSSRRSPTMAGFALGSSGSAAPGPKAPHSIVVVSHKHNRLTIHYRRGERCPVFHGARSRETEGTLVNIKSLQ